MNNRYRPSGEAPFGLIEDGGIDLGDTLEHSLGDLASKTQDVFDDLKDEIGGVFDDVDESLLSVAEATKNFSEVTQNI